MDYSAILSEIVEILVGGITGVAEGIGRRTHYPCN